MCDYSLTHFQSRPAKVGEQLTTQWFNGGTTGLISPGQPEIAVCVLPGTRLELTGPEGLCHDFGLKAMTPVTFQQRSLPEGLHDHRDGIRFDGGTFMLLQELPPGLTMAVIELGSKQAAGEADGAEIVPPELVATRQEAQATAAG